MTYNEEFVYVKILEEIETYTRWLEHEYDKTPTKELYIRLQSVYWFSDMFPLVYNSSLYNIKDFDDNIKYSAITLKVYKVLMSLRQISLNGWTSMVVETIVDDIAYRIFNSGILNVK